MNAPIRRHPASYRDPAGFVYEQDGVIFRQVNYSYKVQYDQLIQSGLYHRLVSEELLIPHEEVVGMPNEETYKILKPKKIPFISYPYEWCHGQLRDAGLLTLKILRIAVDYGMTLKDASAYNIQFVGSEPIFIDTLSFEILEAGKPWVAYRQFCEMFAAPLAIQQYGRQPVSRTLSAWPEGIPIDVASCLLPIRSLLNFNLLLHVHLHARIKKKSETGEKPERKQSTTDRDRLMQSLEELIKKMKDQPARSAWTSYYDEIEEREEYFTTKEKIIAKWIDEIGLVGLTLDAGSNLGFFSRRLTHSKQVIALDNDADTINAIYEVGKKLPNQKTRGSLLPLHLDLSDLSNDQGLLQQERTSFLKRGRFELVMALALIHHLILGKQIPPEQAINILAGLCGKWLILEFVPPEDPWAQKMSDAKQGNTHFYDRPLFEKCIESHFEIIEVSPIPPTDRWLYKLKKKN